MLCGSQLLGAVGAVDLFSSDDKALVGQRQRTLLAVEAILVPGETLVVHHVGAVTEPCKGTASQVNLYLCVFMNVKSIVLLCSFHLFKEPLNNIWLSLLEMNGALWLSVDTIMSLDRGTDNTFSDCF